MLDELFEKGFQETLQYKEETGDPNVSQNYRTLEGYTLGTWQSTQRTNYKKGLLSPDRARRLATVGFKWDLLDDKFEKGFQETLKYKEEKGDSNAPYGYKAPEGYPLGKWLSRQRDYYKKSKLSTQRIERLEKIGFTFAKSY